MGGRWDSTSISVPEVSVVTSVGLDHVDYLGPTLERIAWDKAHIIRHGGLAVLGPGTEETDEVFAERARHVGARLVRVREDAADADVSFTVVRHMQTPDGVTEIETSVLGETYGPLSVNGPAYQAANAACALSAVRLALGGPLDARATRSALGGLRIAGRFEVLAREPWVIADVAHNAGGARVLAEAVARAFGRRPVTVVIGMLTDKDAAAVVSVLAPVAAHFVVTAPDSPRALDARVLAEVVEDVTGTGPVVCPDVAGAVAAACESGSPVLVTGSVVTVAAARVACGVYPG
ncbi:MAG: cyanophycin synthetase, partial [Actinomycetota bacterium]|nr:cyanophycin synthetase [Actinomycetota bacterium]